MLDNPGVAMEQRIILPKLILRETVTSPRAQENK
jgi:hypothetical protein